MREYYNDRTAYDNDLKRLDKEIISNRKQKKQTRSNLLWRIDNMKQPSKKLSGLKYVSSFGLFMALLFLGICYLRVMVRHLTNKPLPHRRTITQIIF